jgi:Holliday junction resolvase RusA-like endonuclease
VPTWRFDVPGQPHPAERPRGLLRRGKGGQMVTVWLTPDRTLAAEQTVADAFRAAHPDAVPLAGEVRLEVVFRRATLRRCDLDNLLKTVMDGLNGLAWRDDSQVAQIVASRLLGVPPGTEGAHVTVLGESATLDLFDTEGAQQT